MLQKYFPIVGEVNSPLAALQVLGFTAEAVKIAISGISNEVLEALLWTEVEKTETRKQEVAVATSELEAAQLAAKKTVRTLRYRAAQAARSARKISKAGRRVKAVRRPTAKSSLKSLKGLDINICRQRAAQAQAAVRSAVNNFSAAHEAVCAAIEGGDTRAIRSSVAALKVVVRTLEVRHIEFSFAREMVSISLARHSA